MSTEIMDYKILTPTQAIAKALLRQPPQEDEVQTFRSAMRDLLSHINPEESEEFNKNLVVEFFNNSLYRDRNSLMLSKKSQIISTMTISPKRMDVSLTLQRTNSPKLMLSSSFSAMPTTL